MSRIGEVVSATRLNEVLNKRDNDKIKKTIVVVLAIVGTVVAIAAIAYAVYRYFAPRETYGLYFPEGEKR